MSWKSQDYKCTACPTTFIEIYRKEDGVPVVPCPSCGGLTETMFAAPKVMTAALPDGVKRGGAWDAARRQAKLEESFDNARDGQEKTEMRKEFIKVGGGEA